MKNFLLAFTCIFLLTKTGNAQPGPQSVQFQYYYKIVDEANNEIAFKTDTTYRIYIANHQPVPEIQQHITDQASYNHFFSSWDVQINDFTAFFSIPEITYDHKFEVAIIHKTDTLFLNQESGFKPRTLQFIPGRYYFPFWSSAVLENLPVTSGETKLMNLNQRNFIVSKEHYSLEPYAFEEKEKLDELIGQRFIDSAYDVKITVENSKLNRSFAPYPAEGLKHLYPTKDSNVFIGTVGFNMNHANYSRSNQVVCLFNKEENTIEYKSQKDHLDQFYCTNLFIDTFNHIYYQTIGFRENSDPQCIDRNDGACAYTKQALRSVDEGKNWTEDKALTSLLQNYEYMKLDFLDENHAVASIQADYYDEKKGHARQALYLLIKNGKVIESLRSPAFRNHIGDYHNAYSLDLQKDSVILGQWKTFDKTESYFSPMVVHENQKWTLVVSKYRQEHAPVYERAVERTEYASFKLEDQKKLVFEHGSLELPQLNSGNGIQQKPSDSGIYLFEEEGMILLHDHRAKYAWFSLDNGKSWYFYPKALDKFYTNYNFLEMENGKLSIFNGQDLRKTIYTFTPITR